MPIEQTSDIDKEIANDVKEQDLEILKEASALSHEAKELARQLEDMQRNQDVVDLAEFKRVHKRAQEIAEIREAQEMREKGKRSVGDAWKAGIQYTTLKTAEKVGKEVRYAPSTMLKRLEDFGTNLIKKNAPYLKYIPFVGPWLLEKAEKSLKEKEEEAQKKRDAAAKKEKKKKEKEKKKDKAIEEADNQLKDDLKEADGDPQKIAEAHRKHREKMKEILEDLSGSDEKDDNKDDKNKEGDKDEGEEEQEAA